MQIWGRETQNLNTEHPYFCVSENSNFVHSKLFNPRRLCMSERKLQI